MCATDWHLFVESRCHGSGSGFLAVPLGIYGYILVVAWHWPGTIGLIDFTTTRLAQRATDWGTTYLLSIFRPMNFTFPRRGCGCRPCCCRFCPAWGTLIIRPASRSLLLVLFEFRSGLFLVLPKNKWGERMCGLGSPDPLEPFIMHCTGFPCTSGPSFLPSLSG